MVRVVLDTSVVVAAFRSAHGASNAILDLVSQRRLRPLVSVPLFLEYEAVLKRPEQLVAHRRLPAQVDQILAALLSGSEKMSIWFRWRPQLSDAADEMVLDTAINGRAKAIVTHNVRDFELASRRFGIVTLTPGQFMRELDR